MAVFAAVAAGLALSTGDRLSALVAAVSSPAFPKIAQFFSEDASYAAINEDAVRLGWQISDPDRLQSLKITGLSPKAHCSPVQKSMTLARDARRVATLLHSNTRRAGLPQYPHQCP